MDLYWKNNPFNVKWKFYRRINLRVQWRDKKVEREEDSSERGANGQTTKPPLPALH